MKLIVGNDNETRAEVWLKAVDYLANNTDFHEEYNLILHIPNPINGNNKGEFIEQEFGQLLAASNCESLHTVAETIFPFSEYRLSKNQGVFEDYPEVTYPKIKKLPGNTRGTYAYRILRGTNWKNEECRPLENIIQRLKTQLSNRGTIRMAYELPVSDITNVSDITDINIAKHDTNTRGFPCMSHISFKICPKKKALLTTVIYRSHDYLQKALGNFLGITRLQWFVANEVGLDVGELTCVSTYASIKPQAALTLNNINKLIEDTGKYNGC